MGQLLVTYPKDLPLALRTLRGKELLIADLAIQSPFLFHKSNVSHRGFAMSTVKLLWMPRLPQSNQEGSSD